MSTKVQNQPDDLEIQRAARLFTNTQELNRIQALIKVDKDYFAKHCQGQDVEVPDVGTVKVSKPTEERVEGVVAKFDPKAFFNMTKTRQKNLLKEGIVAVGPKIVKASAPRITLKETTA